MCLEVCNLQTGKREFRIDNVKPSSKPCFVSLVLAAQRFIGKFTRFGKAREPTLCMFQFAPTFFDKEFQVVNRLFFEAAQGAVHRLCRAHFGTRITALENIPLQLGTNRPFRFQERQIPCIKFLVAEQRYRRIVIGLGRLYSILVAFAFDTQLTEPRMLFNSESLEFFHRTDAFRRFHGSRRGKTRVRMQKACKRHTGQRLIAQSVFVSVFCFSKRNFGTEAFRLANLTAFFQFLGAIQMFFEVPLGCLAHYDKFFAQTKRKVLCRHIHEHRVLRHLEFGLAGVHVFLGGIVCGINLETRKNGPHDGQAGVKEPIILHLHVEIGIFDLLGGFLALAFSHFHGGIVSVLAAHDPAPDIGRFGIHIGFGRFFVHARFHRLAYSLLISFSVSSVVCRKISLGISGSPGNIAQRLLNSPKVNRNRVINLGNACRQAHRREESGKSFVFTTFGYIHFRLFGLDLRIVGHSHVQRIL